MATEKRAFKIFNTLTSRLEVFSPVHAEKNTVAMYVCGPTVYDDAHLGHARCYITWDVLYRFLKFLDYDVTYSRNITDVDDKILNRARANQEEPAALTQRNYESFKADMAALNVLSPDQEPFATHYIPEMIAGVQALLDSGAAYFTPDGSAYFRVSAKADYGKLKFGTQDPALLKKHLDDLKAGARVEVDDGKESPLDFALWKAIPSDDQYGWKAEWKVAGKVRQSWGRPGWHLECSAMNHALHGAQIDIHAGGADLIFPHHENEIAQSEAWTGETPFAKYWLHNGFVNVSGEKMSKSLGNFSTVKALLTRYDANAIRHFLLTNGYRMPVDFNDDTLQSAQTWANTRARWLRNAMTALSWAPEQVLVETISSAALMAHFASALETVPAAVNEFEKLITSLGDDLNSAAALAHLNGALTALKAATPESDGTPEQLTLLEPTFRATVSMWQLLGFNLAFAEPEEMLALPLAAIQTIYSAVMPEGSDAQRPADVLLVDILERRKQAKREKEWAMADAIRDHFVGLGWQLLDKPGNITVLEQNATEIFRA